MCIFFNMNRVQLGLSGQVVPSRVARYLSGLVRYMVTMLNTNVTGGRAEEARGGSRSIRSSRYPEIGPRTGIRRGWKRANAFQGHRSAQEKLGPSCVFSRQDIIMGAVATVSLTSSSAERGSPATSSAEAPVTRARPRKAQLRGRL